FDWESVRASRLLSAVPENTSVVHGSSFAELARVSEGRPAAVLAMPLDWPEAPPPAAAVGISSPVLEFLRKNGRRFPILVYGDTNRMPISVYCRALAAGARQVINEATPNFSEDLGQTLLRLVEDHRNHLDAEQHLSERFASQGLIGSSPSMRE